MEADAEPAGKEDVDPAALSIALSTIKSMLSVRDEQAGTGFLSCLEDAVKSYAIDLSLRPFYGNPAQQKRLVLQLAGSLEKSVRLLLQVAPEYLVTIESMSKPDVHGSKATTDPIEQLERLADAAHRIAEGYAPKLGAATNLPLEEAVRKLIPLIEGHTGGGVTVSMNKNKGCSPMLASSEARAIGVLLRVADPMLPDATIANMIEKVRREPTPSESHLCAIWRADPQAILEMSLLPGRHGRD